jgi:hypothetical protein
VSRAAVEKQQAVEMLQEIEKQRVEEMETGVDELR